MSLRVRAAARPSASREVLHLELLHVAVVFVQRSRECMRAIVPADEIQIVGVRRSCGGFERAFPRSRNRARRQTRIPVGVVGRIECEIVPT